jgi:phage portal protein BeeE
VISTDLVGERKRKEETDHSDEKRIEKNVPHPNSQPRSSLAFTHLLRSGDTRSNKVHGDGEDDSASSRPDSKHVAVPDVVEEGLDEEGESETTDSGTCVEGGRDVNVRC